MGGGKVCEDFVKIILPTFKRRLVQNVSSILSYRFLCHLFRLNVGAMDVVVYFIDGYTFGFGFVAELWCDDLV